MICFQVAGQPGPDSGYVSHSSGGGYPKLQVVMMVTVMVMMKRMLIMIVMMVMTFGNVNHNSGRYSKLQVDISMVLIQL